ncbi:hypothetical protein D779_1412 [Imhoffiella purpurea]|uniref:Uncharacterized protein n=1 Tax=Imhoffiella purpurea TaxID=1249627 RepID=W9VEC3_9GAMM|nr:hypothetical protein D779_1412 [Imhoffiella purpurea]
MTLDQRFDRFDWVEANMHRAKDDPRPESFRVDQGTLSIVRSGRLNLHSGQLRHQRSQESR